MTKGRQEPLRNYFVEEKTSWWHVYLLPFYLIIGVTYLVWRFEISFLGLLWYTLPLFVVETYNTFTTIIHLFVSRRIFHPQYLPPLENVTVDAFIPTYNEPDEIIEMTATAALAMKRVRNVFILDDGKRENIKKLARRIGAKYLARPDNKYAKAGNMNYGLAHSDSEYVVFFDCDHVPLSNFIERTLGYFRNEKLAFVQTPQIFYNTDTIEFRKLHSRTLWNEQTMFYESIQPAKNAFGAGFFCGTGAILRRSAIDSVGGFATETATEDIHTSLKLHAQGWKSIFLPEKLVFGLAPEDLKEYHKQRVRWGAGSLGLLFRSTDSPLRARGLTFWQRICYFNSTNAYFYGGLIKLFYISTPIFVILSLPFNTQYNSMFFFQYLAISLPFVLFSDIIIYIYSRKTYHALFTEQYNIANIFSCIEALKGVFKIQKKFRVSIKSKSLRENHIVYYFIVGLFIILAAAEIFGFLYWFGVLGKTSVQFMKSFDAIALFWNTWNLVIVGSFVWFLQGYAKRAQPKYPFESQDIVIVDNLVCGRLSRIGLSGAYAVIDKIPSNKNILLTIKTRDHIIHLKAMVAAHKSLDHSQKFVELSFTQLTKTERKNLIQYFFQELVADVFKNEFTKNISPNKSLVPQYQLSRAYEVDVNS